jgi:hypothetical protein
MTTTPVPATHSADVTLRLILPGRTLELSQIGPREMVVREPVDLAPCFGEIVMTVDEREHRWPVRLHNGMRRGGNVVAISE